MSTTTPPADDLSALLTDAETDEVTTHVPEGPPLALDLNPEEPEEEPSPPPSPIDQELAKLEEAKEAIAQLQAGHELFMTEAKRIEEAINEFEPVLFNMSALSDGQIPRVTALCDQKFSLEINAGSELGEGVARVAITCPFPTTKVAVADALGVWEALLNLYPGPDRKWLVDTLLLVGNLRNEAHELAVKAETEFVGLAEQALTVEDYQYILHSDPAGRLWTLVVKYLHP